MPGDARIEELEKRVKALENEVRELKSSKKAKQTNQYNELESPYDLGAMHRGSKKRGLN